MTAPPLALINVLVPLNLFRFYVRSKPELAKALGPIYDLSAFDFMTGKINPLLIKTKNNAASGIFILIDSFPHNQKALKLV